MSRRLTVAVLLLSACVRREAFEEESLALQGATLLTVDVARGDVSWRSATDVTRDVLDVRATRWGRAGRAEEAAARLQSTAWSAGIEQGVARVQATAGGTGSGVDLDLTGPRLLDLDWRLDDGDAFLDDVEGSWTVVADDIQGRSVAGEGQLVAGGTLDVEVFPYLDGFVELEGDDVFLTLAPFEDYDLFVSGVGGEAVVDDLGFDSVVFTADGLEARREPGSIRIDVRVRGGDFVLTAGR